MNVNLPSAVLGLTVVAMAMMAAGLGKVPFGIVPIGALAAAIAVGVGFLPRKTLRTTFNDYVAAAAIYAAALFVMTLLYAIGVSGGVALT